MATDCVPCHFEYEEKRALPYLPLAYRVWLMSEHADLKRRGYPAAEVLAHAERELPIFRRFVPPEIVAEIEDDHERFHPVLVRRARLGLGTPSTRIA